MGKSSQIFALPSFQLRSKGFILSVILKERDLPPPPYVFQFSRERHLHKGSQDLNLTHKVPGYIVFHKG